MHARALREPPGQPLRYAFCFVAILTQLPLDDAKRIGSLYGLDVVGVRGILAGSVNSNYALELADEGRVFLRVFEEQAQAAASGEARLLDHLASAGVPTPRPLLRNDGAAASFIASHHGKPVAVFPWVDGEILCQRRVTKSSASRVGEALARVHVAGASFQDAPASRFDAQRLATRLREIDRSAAGGELARTIDDLTRRLDEMPPRAPETAGVIHGDLFRDNVLWRGEEIAALLDFESASRGSAAFDLGVTLLAWCYGDDLDPGLSRALASGYCAVRPLAEDERRALHDEARFAALRFAITRITDFELRPRESGVYKDYRRFLGRLSALDRLGPDGLTTFLGV